MRLIDVIYFSLIGILFSSVLIVLDNNKLNYYKEHKITCNAELYDRLINIDQFLIKNYSVKLIDDYWDLYLNITSDNIFEINLKYVTNGKIIYEKQLCGLSKTFVKKHEIEYYYDYLQIDFISSNETMDIYGCVGLDNDRKRRRVDNILI